MATDTTEEVTEETKEMKTLEREHYEAIKELNEEFRVEYAEWEFLKDKTSAAKKTVDEISKRLSYLIARGPDKQAKLPFDQAEAVDPLGWREQDVAGSLGLTAKILEKLEGAGVTTIGELEDLRAGSGLASIKGIGQATADKIEEQVLEWLSENRDKFGESVEEPEDDDEAEDDDSEDDIDI